MDEPTPGSPAAVEAGCACPVLDNNHGSGFVMDGDKVFWIAENCPLHGQKKHGSSHADDQD